MFKKKTIKNNNSTHALLQTDTHIYIHTTQAALRKQIQAEKIK